MIKNQAAGLEAKLQKKKKKLLSEKNSIKDLKKKLSEAIARTEEVEKKTKLVEANALKAVDDFKKLATFDEDVTKASLHCYEYGFNDCNAKVAGLFPSLDLNKVIIEEETTEGVKFRRRMLKKPRPRKLLLLYLTKHLLFLKKP